MDGPQGYCGLMFFHFVEGFDCTGACPNGPCDDCPFWVDESEGAPPPVSSAAGLFRKEVPFMSDRCIMPEMPYCPACRYGYIVYPEWVEMAQDLEGCSCEWVCLLEGAPPHV